MKLAAILLVLLASTAGATVYVFQRVQVVPPADWSVSLLAAWMLDESGTTTRVNTQGTTTRNLVPNQSIPNDTTNKMEGAAAIAPTTGAQLTASDAGFDAMVNTFSVGCWVRPTDVGAIHPILQHWNGSQGWFLDYPNDNTIRWLIYPSSGAYDRRTPPISQNVWTHVVGTYNHPTMAIYTNASPSATFTVPVAAAPAVSTQLKMSETFGTQAWPGQLDECFVANNALSPQAVCRICSCGIRGEKCSCQGSSYYTTGRNTSNCSGCTLPADCQASAPP